MTTTKPVEDAANTGTMTLVARLREIADGAGAAWGPSLVDGEVEGIVRELESRGTTMAREGLLEIVPFWYQGRSDECPAARYRAVLIFPCSSGFGEYECSEANGEDWADDNDLRDAMAEGISHRGGEFVELGGDPVPAWAEDIRGKIRNEPERVFAALLPGQGPDHADDVLYYGITSR